jgi:signal transduction histidine kinase
MISLKWKIQLWHAAVLAVVLAGLSVVFYLNERGHKLNEFDDALDQTVHPVLHELAVQQGLIPGQIPPPGGASAPGRHPLDQIGQDVLPGGWVPLKELDRIQISPKAPPRPRDGKGRAIEFLERRFSNYGFYIIAWDMRSEGHIYASKNAPDIPLPTDRGGYWKRTRAGQYREILHNNPHNKLLVGFDLASYYAEMDALKWKIAGSALLIFLGGIAVGGILVAHSLKPLRVIEQTTSAIAAGRLQDRIPELKGNRTAELAHLTDDLNHTFTQLESFFQKQIRFTADASHELRTPLTALMAQISLGLNRRREPEEYEQMLQVCDKSTHRLKMIIEDLLDLSRYDSGTYKLERETLPLDALVQSLVEELKPYVAEKGSVLKTELKGKTICCDPFRFEQVITNLVNNALQHNKGAVEIMLRATDADNCAIVEVIDNGIGIQPENLDKLFDRFFQEDESRKHKARHLNSGLGLSISKAIIEAHGGTLAVRSTPHVETVFTIRLPASDS